MTTKKKPSESRWLLDPGVIYLNHGSFGACPRATFAYQQKLRRQMESQPMRWFNRTLPELLEKSRRQLGKFLGASADRLAFVPNATYGVNSVLRSLPLARGDEILITDHEYNACRNAAVFAAQSRGARVKTAHLPFPLRSQGEVVEAVISKITRRTRLLLIDHITSPTALVLPVGEIISRAHRLGVEVLIDGAHAPGMLPLKLDLLGADYYTGNLHKWLCAPKGAAFLYVRPEHQEKIFPLAISHGYNTRKPGQSKLRALFDWTGTDDFTAFVCWQKSLEVLQSIYPGGLTELRRRNHRLVVEGRRLVLKALGQEPPCPEFMLGSMATVFLPLASAGNAPVGGGTALQKKLSEKYGVEVPVINWPVFPHLLLRISAQAYNRIEHYQYLAEVLARELSE